MAKKKDKEKDSGETKAKGGNKGLMIVLFLLGLIVLGVAAFAGSYLFFKANSNPVAQEEKEVVIEQKYIDLEEFTINLGDESGKRYFKGELSLGIDKKDTDTETEITDNVVVIRDAIIFYFKSQKAEYINDVNNKDAIKEALIEAINKELIKGKITDIRFKNMLVQ